MRQNVYVSRGSVQMSISQVSFLGFIASLMAVHNHKFGCR